MRYVNQNMCSIYKTNHIITIEIQIFENYQVL